MKKFFPATLAFTCARCLMAEVIDSPVIHNYNYFGFGYSYVSGNGDTPDAQGGSGVFSYEHRNVVVGFGGGFQVVDTSPQLDVWMVSGSLGYVFRAQENRINVVPRFGVGYSQATAQGFRSESTAISPGIALSFAANNRLSFGAGYSYTYDLDSEADAHGFSVGTQVMLTAQVGLNLAAIFTDHDGFEGISTGVSIHF